MAAAVVQSRQKQKAGQIVVEHILNLITKKYPGLEAYSIYYRVEGFYFKLSSIIRLEVKNLL